MTASQELREYALYDHLCRLYMLPSDGSWRAAMGWLNWSEGSGATPTERRMFLLFVAEALENP